jgi:Holliday junction resolvase-like predicted endonuclease
MAKKPSLDIALGAPDIQAFKAKMNEASNHVGSVARQIGKQFLDLNVGIRDGLLASASRMAIGMVAKVALIAGSLKLMSDAISGAREQLADMVALADKAQNIGVSPQFLQWFTNESRKLKVEAGELEAALGHAFSATTEKSPIDVGAWETGKEKISDVEKALRVYNETLAKAAGQRLEGLVLFRNATDQDQKVKAVLAAMVQLEQIGQRAASLDLGQRMFGSQFVERIRHGRTSAESMLATIRETSANSDGIFSNVLVQRAKELDDQLKVAHQRLSTALKPSWDDLASVLLTIKGVWSDTINLIAKAVELSNKIKISGFTSDTDIDAKRDALGKVNARLNGTSSWTDTYGVLASRETLESHRDRLQKEIAALAQGDAYGPVKPAVDRGTGAAPTLKPTDSGADKLQGAIDSTEKRIAALKAEAAAVDLTAEARNRSKIVAQLETVAMQANAAAGKGANVVTEEQRRKIEEVANAYAQATKAMEKAQIASDIRRGSQTALLDPQDVQIAERLRSIYPDVASALGSVEASAMRANDVMKSIGNTMSSSLTSGLTDILDGTKSVSQGFSDMSRVIVRALQEALVKMLIVQPLMRSLGGMMGGFGGGAAGSIAIGSYMMPTFADGGRIDGPGTGRSDSIVARVSNGEFITNAQSTAKHLALLQAINADRIPRFADGGVVGSVPALSGGSQTTVAPVVNVTVQGSPGASQADHEAMGRTIASQIEPAIRGIVAKELRIQMRPGGILR